LQNEYRRCRTIKSTERSDIPERSDKKIII
jgi:hypothetical protein